MLGSIFVDFSKVSANNVPQPLVVQNFVGHIDGIKVVSRLQGVEFCMNVVESV